MPVLILYTSEESFSEEQIAAIQKDSIKILSEQLNKSKEFVMTLLHTGCPLTFGDDKKNCAYVEIKNVGDISADTARKISRQLCVLMEEVLGMDPKKTYLEFQESKRHLWGWAGKNFS